MPFTPIWRLTLYNADNTVLTAGVTGFKVASATGVTGYQPYLEVTEGKRGRFDALTRKRETGAIALRVLDRKLGTSDFSRFVTQFMGDSSGRFRLNGKKAKLELTDDNGALWSTVLTGRVYAVEFDDSRGVVLRFTIRETIDALASWELFTRAPNTLATGASTSRLWPVAPNALDYGPWSPTYRGVSMKVVTTSAAEMTLVVEGTTNVQYNLTSESLEQRGKLIRALTGGWSAPRGRVRVKYNPGTGDVTKHFELVDVLAGGGDGLRYIFCRPLPTADPFYNATLALNTTCQVEVWAADAPTDDAPLYIDDVHPVLFLEDVLKGYYGPLSDAGVPVFTHPYNAASFTTLKADNTIPKARFVIRRREKALDFVESQILLPFGLGIRENGDGEIVVYDARVPTALPSVTLAEADLIADSVSWVGSVEGALNQVFVKFYEDVEAPVSAATAVASRLARRTVARTTLVEEIEHEYLRVDLASVADIGDRKLTVDARGLRFTRLDTDRVGQLQRAQWLVGVLDALTEGMRRPFGDGPQYVRANFRRNATTRARVEGEVVLLDLDAVPDTSSSTRGGVRLVRIVEWTDNGDHFAGVCLDLGRNATAVVPTLSGEATDASDTSHLVNLTVTLNAAADPVEVWYNITTTAVGVRPADSDAGWVFGFRRVASGSITLYAPANSRVWFRARSVPLGNQQLPSAWAYPLSYVQTAVLPAITGLAASSIFSRSATISWTPGSTNLYTEVSLDNFATRYAMLDPGVKAVELTDLTPSTITTAYVRHTDGGTGTGPITSVTFTTTATANVCPAMSGISVVVGG